MFSPAGQAGCAPHRKRDVIPFWFPDKRSSQRPRQVGVKKVEGGTQHGSRDNFQIQSAISNTPDIVSKNVGLMD